MEVRKNGFQFAVGSSVVKERGNPDGLSVGGEFEELNPKGWPSGGANLGRMRGGLYEDRGLVGPKVVTLDRPAFVQLRGSGMRA
ncbi:hypothetical protein LguiB_002510 [Lonicera macranthoides]